MNVTCRTCLSDMPADAFSKAKGKPSGLQRSCKSCCKKYQSEYRARTGYAEAQKQRVAEWRDRNPAAVSAGFVRWRDGNRERYLNTRRQHYRSKSGKPDFVLANRVRRGVNRSLREGKKSESTFAFVGYSLADLSSHIERQFSAGMGWHNADQWHIDHIRPLSSFSDDETSLKAAWALTNLRPIWARENLVKHAKQTHLL